MGEGAVGSRQSSLQLRVYYEDTDASGVVYHANYLRYCERARTEWLDHFGFGHRQLAEDYGIAFTLSHVEIAFRAPARLDDRLEIYTRIAKRRRVSMVFAQEIHCRDRLLVKALFTVACVRLGDFKPCGLPAMLLKELE